MAEIENQQCARTTERCRRNRVILGICSKPGFGLYRMPPLFGARAFFLNLACSLGTAFIIRSTYSALLPGRVICGM